MRAHELFTRQPLNCPSAKGSAHQLLQLALPLIPGPPCLFDHTHGAVLHEPKSVGQTRSHSRHSRSLSGTRTRWPGQSHLRPCTALHSGLSRSRFHFSLSPETFPIYRGRAPPWIRDAKDQPTSPAGQPARKRPRAGGVEIRGSGGCEAADWRRRREKRGRAHEQRCETARPDAVGGAERRRQ